MDEATAVYKEMNEGSVLEEVLHKAEVKCLFKIESNVTIVYRYILLG